MKKRFLSVLLCVCMVLSLTPVMAFAASPAVGLQLAQVKVTNPASGVDVTKTDLVGFNKLDDAKNNPANVITVPYSTSPVTLKGNLQFEFTLDQFAKANIKESEPQNLGLYVAVDETICKTPGTSGIGCDYYWMDNNKNPDKRITLGDDHTTNENVGAHQKAEFIDDLAVRADFRDNGYAVPEVTTEPVTLYVSLVMKVEQESVSHYTGYGGNELVTIYKLEIKMENPSESDDLSSDGKLKETITLNNSVNVTVDNPEGGEGTADKPYEIETLIPSDDWDRLAQSTVKMTASQPYYEIHAYGDKNSFLQDKYETDRTDYIKNGENITLGPITLTLTDTKTKTFWLRSVSLDRLNTYCYTINLIKSDYIQDHDVTKRTLLDENLENKLKPESEERTNVYDIMDTLEISMTDDKNLTNLAFTTVTNTNLTDSFKQSSQKKLDLIDPSKNRPYHYRVHTYVDIIGLDYDQTNGSFVFDIDPKYTLSVTHKATGDMVYEGSDKAANAVMLKTGSLLDSVDKNQSSKITLTLPDSFLNNRTSAFVRINDTQSSTRYPVNFGTVTFDSFPFSTFDLTLNGGSVKINDSYFDTLQNAIDYLKTDNTSDTIVLLGEQKDPAVVDFESKITLTTDKELYPDATDEIVKSLLTAGPTVELLGDQNPTGSLADGGITFTFTSKAPDTVLTTETENGTIKLSSTTAKAEETVTITPTPNEGYLVDEVTVTDKQGNDIEETDNKDGTYSFTMPADDAQPVTVSVTFKKDDSSEPGPGPDTEQNPTFTDAPAGAWYSEAVNYVTSKGLMKGTSGTTFDPDMKTSRGMVVTILHRLEGEPSAAPASFNDVPSGQWYSDAVNWATANNIVSGYGNGNFGPNDIVTREGIATILYRYAALKGYDTAGGTDLSTYVDSAAVSSYAVDAMNWAVTKGLINGTSTTTPTLSPAGDTSRAEIATILTRFCEQVAK